MLICSPHLISLDVGPFQSFCNSSTSDLRLILRTPGNETFKPTSKPPFKRQGGHQQSKRMQKADPQKASWLYLCRQNAKVLMKLFELLLTSASPRIRQIPRTTFMAMDQWLMTAIQVATKQLHSQFSSGAPFLKITTGQKTLLGAAKVTLMGFESSRSLKNNRSIWYSAFNPYPPSSPASETIIRRISVNIF